jgi:hypothetical protein
MIGLAIGRFAVSDFGTFHLSPLVVEHNLSFFFTDVPVIVVLKVIVFFLGHLLHECRVTGRKILFLLRG